MSARIEGKTRTNGALLEVPGDLDREGPAGVRNVRKGATCTGSI